jgi:transcriptional regulator with XRE-family HTH domain
MPRPQKYLDSPFFRLRKILEVNQTELAELVTVSFNLIQQVEAKRLNLTPAVLELVRHNLGAVWDTERQQWLLDPRIRAHVGVEDPVTPFSKELLERFQQFKGLSPRTVPLAQQDRDLAIMHEALDQLSEKCVLESVWTSFVQFFSGFVEQAAEHFSSVPAEEIFQAAEAKAATKRPPRKRKADQPSELELMTEGMARALVEQRSPPETSEIKAMIKKERPRMVTDPQTGEVRRPRASDERQSGKGPGPGEVMPASARRKRTPA